MLSGTRASVKPPSPMTSGQSDCDRRSIGFDDLSGSTAVRIFLRSLDPQSIVTYGPSVVLLLLGDGDGNAAAIASRFAAAYSESVSRPSS